MKPKDLTSRQMQTLIKNILDDHKAVDITIIDVRKLTSITDYMIICSGTSTRHVKAMADQLVTKCKAEGIKPLGTEGERGAEWILIDLVDVIVHIMLPQAREFYNLEKLWQYNKTTKK